MRAKLLVCTLASIVALTGCANWSTTSARHVNRAAVAQETDPEAVTITAADITDRPYVVIGDVVATVRKSTVFNADPTRKMVNEKLQERAAQLGADAVILVQYNRSGFSPLSWGALSGRGRAVRFQPAQQVQ
ncbi:heavy metal-binding domain-containing protein [Paraburkholderia bengalensis]|uniref:Heavy metal-binding domain-containing protein n=1 Tax=Paraburkholderia bengalensis TaxID=2747562 RepID=A0ABU8J4Z0_9BURK